jgi:hypothetical protein
MRKTKKEEITMMLISIDKARMSEYIYLHNLPCAFLGAGFFYEKR